MTNRSEQSSPAEQILPTTAQAPEGELGKPVSDRLLLGGAGAVLLGLAGVFGWRELQVDPAYLLTIAATAGLGASAMGKNKVATRAGLLTLLVCAALGGAFYAAARSGALLPGLLVAALGGLLFLGRGYPRAKFLGDQATITLGFGVLVATTLVASWAGYFHFLTAGVAADAVARRLVLTLLWVAAGVALVVFSSKQRELAMRHAGYLFVIAATGKALLYDTTHLDGGLRVLVLLAAGACLLGGAALSARKERQ